MPDDWSDEDAAQLGVAPFTAAQTLWSSQEKFPTPFAPGTDSTPLLVSSGASSVGQYVIQFAKLSGFKVIAFASPKNFELVRSLGADEVFDYKDPYASQKVKEITNGQLKFAVDTISEKQTPQQIADALSDEGGVVSVILPCKTVRDNVKVVHSLAYDLLGKVRIALIFILMWLIWRAPGCRTSISPRCTKPMRSKLLEERSMQS